MDNITPLTPITVGELRELIAGLDDDLAVVVEDVHAYRPITGGQAEDIGWNLQGVHGSQGQTVLNLSMPFEATDAEGNEVVFGVRQGAP